MENGADALGVRSGRPVRSDLFEATPDGPRLRGARCVNCGRVHFPAGEACPFCGAGDVAPELLPGDGTLWAWTAVTAAPPGYRGEVPYGFGVVELAGELAGGVRVVTRLTEADPARLTAGQRMRLVIVPLHLDDEGRHVESYAFAPGAGGS